MQHKTNGGEITQVFIRGMLVDYTLNLEGEVVSYYAVDAGTTKHLPVFNLYNRLVGSKIRPVVVQELEMLN